MFIFLNTLYKKKDTKCFIYNLIQNPNQFICANNLNLFHDKKSKPIHLE